MARARPDLYVHPELGAALRHLRSRTALRQADVAAQTGISIVWLSHLETGKGHPTHPTLDALLRALGSDRAELESLLAARPWDVGEGAEWAGPAAATTPPPPPTLAGPLPAAAPPPPEGVGPSAPRGGAPLPPPATGDAAPLGTDVAAQAAELGALLALLAPADRVAVLGEAKRRLRR